MKLCGLSAYEDQMKQFSALLTMATAMAMAVCATTAVAASDDGSARPLKLNVNHRSRSVDCQGRDLILSGDNNDLTLVNCGVINVLGNRNQMRVQLLPTSTISAIGDYNHIVFRHAPGIEVQVTSTGKGNEIIPVMDRDAGDKSPVHFPIGPTGAGT